MPVVPFSRQLDALPKDLQPDETHLMMAAATMHQLGKFKGYSVSRSPGEDFSKAEEEASREFQKGKIAPYARGYDEKTDQLGPLNINPKSIPADR
jgi:hypothetical protein